jgi:hypothetical protein
MYVCHCATIVLYTYDEYVQGTALKCFHYTRVTLYSVNYKSNEERQVPVVLWSNAYVCGRSTAGIAVSNPAEDMDVGLLCFV